MINVARPLVMYQSMSLSLDQIALSTPEVKFLDAQMEVDGKRGNVTLQFSINEGEKAIGRGEKKCLCFRVWVLQFGSRFGPSSLVWFCGFSGLLSPPFMLQLNQVFMLMEDH